jgi:hypothetical protein
MSHREQQPYPLAELYRQAVASITPEQQNELAKQVRELLAVFVQLLLATAQKALAAAERLPPPTADEARALVATLSNILREDMPRAPAGT